MTLLALAIAPFRNIWLRTKLGMTQDELSHMNLGMSNAKVPPGWTPEKDKVYPLRTWVQDIRLWSIGTDVDALKQGAVAAMRIGGTAKELIRELDVNVLANGMNFADDQGNLIHHTGLECLIRALSRRYAPLAQELEVHCIAEILQFRRNQGEDTDALISRFELTREKALNGAGFDMSWVGFAFLLLCILGIHKSQWPLLLAPTQGSLPSTQAEYTTFCQYVRRQGHLTDKGVDGVKNMTFYTAPGDYGQDTSVTTMPTYVSWNSHQQQQHHHAVDHESVFWNSDSHDDDEISSCNSGESNPDISDTLALPYNVAGEQLYLAYRHHKRRWRKFTGGFKRRGKVSKGKGKRKSKFSGKSPGFNPGFSSGFSGRKGKGKGRMFFADEYGQYTPVDSELHDWYSSTDDASAYHADQSQGSWSE